MKKLLLIFSILLFLTAAVINCRRGSPTSKLNITHPFMNALIPPEFPAPVFEWWSEAKDTASYEVTLIISNKKYEIHDITYQQSWRPDETAWDSLKILSENKEIHFTLRRKGERDFSSVSFRISEDTVGAPVLYSQMPIPYRAAEKQLDSMSYMLINFGSKEQPHTAMKGIFVCGNCHSFAADGREMGLDLNTGIRTKGGYFISKVEDTIKFNQSNYNSWTKLEKRRTFGFFSKMSPDGRYIVTTVKDRVLVKNFMNPPMENVYYSQLLFPVNGHLAIYDRKTKTLKELPGAESDEYVHSNATWTPDGKHIIFCRAKALKLESDSSGYYATVTDEQVINDFVDRKREFKYDLCIIPFNDGNGGVAEPIEGASDNGKSNYFPAVSPDGKWLAYCQAENFMLLQPDARLYIVPLYGGKAKELKCNFNSMNSWHAWSPNSKWITYVSKGLSPLTDLFLTHIDEKGNASIPVLIDKARVHFKVVNYPEFVNIPADQTFVMDYDFVEPEHVVRAYTSGDWDKVKQLLHKMEMQDLYFFREDYKNLSGILRRMGMTEEADRYDDLAELTVDASVFGH